MVATRNHPRDFDPPSATAESPTKRSTRTSSATMSASAPTLSPSKATSALQSAMTPRGSSGTAASRQRRDGWSHTPSNLTLIWLAVSLPLVIWDTGYVLLRPYSMPGGALHKPIWSPYALYGTVDHVYGFEAWEARNGWTAAQGSVNALETVAYLLYAYVVYTYGQQEATQGRGAPAKGAMGRLAALSESRTVYGGWAVLAVLLAYTTAWLTFSKTVLYWLIEAFSGFHSIGHNDLVSLIFLWIIPNGAWLVFPCYMMYVFGQEIIEGLTLATGPGVKES